MLKNIMATALSLTVAFALYTKVNAEALEPIVINSDGGGLVYEYINRAERWNLDKQPVQIAGSCWSACVMYLTLVDDICVYKSASFHMHAPYHETQLFGKLYKEEMTAFYLSHIPEVLQRWISLRGGLGRDWLHLHGTMVSKYLPLCEK